MLFQVGKPNDMLQSKSGLNRFRALEKTAVYRSTDEYT